MKQTSGPVYDTIREDYVNSVLPILIAEWNQNRYYRTVVDNTPAEDTDGFDIELFPIDSITEANRPTSGIAKAIVGQSLVASRYNDVVPEARYYTCSVDDVYKYWQSPESSSATPPYNIANCAPQVLYVEEEDVAGSPVGRTVKANKIAFTVENTYASPDDYDVQIKTSVAGAWTTVASDIAIPSDGRVELWWNGTAWTQTANYANNVDIYGVRLVINSMDKESYFNLIELGVRLELDLTPDVSEIGDDFNMGEVDYITPLGTVSANGGNVTLFNEHRKYSNANTDSILYDLLDKNVKFTLTYRYDGVNDVPQFEFYSDTWTENEEETAVTLFDGSKYLMDAKPPVLLYEQIPVQEAIWRMLDSVGFTKYIVTAIDETPHSIIDIFWTTGEQTVWEVIQELSKGTQTAVFFDSEGYLRIKTRDAAFDATQSPVWTLREITSGVQLPDIISLSESDLYEANKVVVNYQPTGFSEQVGNITPMEVVWEPEGTVVLRSSDLQKNLMLADTYIHLLPQHGKVWPWKGICQIEGEWIEYEGKEYNYYNGTTRTTVIVKDHAEQKRLDATSDVAKAHLNSYTGRLLIKERGLWNTEPMDHPVDASGWTKTRRMNYTTNYASGGFKHNKTDSTVTLAGRSTWDMNDYLYAYRGNGVDQGWRYLGTRLRIDKTAHRHKTAGIFFNADNLGNGYYVEIMATSRMSGTMRKTRNELLFYSMKSDGTKKAFGGERIANRDRSKSSGGTVRTDIGAEQAVLAGRYLDLDIYFSVSGSNHIIQVWCNGRLALEATVSAASGWQHSWVSRFGMYTRGHTSATFEYIYGISRNDILYTDEETFLDRINGGYIGDQWQRDWVYNTREVRRKIRKRWTKVTQKYSQRFFDEFGPIVHEVREFDVKFNTDGLPVLQSRLFHTNTTQTVCPEYVHDVMGASFLLANTSRQNAVVNGEDTLTAMGEGSIDQKLFIYGRPVIQKDTEKIEKTDEWALRRRGPIETEYQSKWTQNKTEAENFATWLTTHWTRSDAVANVEIFGNPLFELGDVVAVQYGEMLPETHLFYVTGIKTDFDAGITTSLTLRRVTI